MGGILRQTLQDSPLIMPEVMLGFFGMAILVTDFFLEPRQKAWNALTTMLGVIFSGISLFMLVPLASTARQRFGDVVRGARNDGDQFLRADGIFAAGPAVERRRDEVHPVGRV